MEVRMSKFWIAGIAALAIAGSTAVYAQHHRYWGHMRARTAKSAGWPCSPAWAMASARAAGATANSSAAWTVGTAAGTAVLTGIAMIATAARAGVAPSGCNLRPPTGTSGEATGIQRLFA